MPSAPWDYWVSMRTSKKSLSGKQAMGQKLLYIHPKMEADMVQWLLKDPPKMEQAPRKVIKPLKEEIEKLKLKGDELPW